MGGTHSVVDCRPSFQKVNSEDFLFLDRVLKDTDNDDFYEVELDIPVSLHVWHNSDAALLAQRSVDPKFSLSDRCFVSKFEIYVEEDVFFRACREVSDLKFFPFLKESEELEFVFDRFREKLKISREVRKTLTGCQAIFRSQTRDKSNFFLALDFLNHPENRVFGFFCAEFCNTNARDYLDAERVYVFSNLIDLTLKRLQSESPAERKKARKRVKKRIESKKNSFNKLEQLEEETMNFENNNVEVENQIVEESFFEKLERFDEEKANNEKQKEMTETESETTDTDPEGVEKKVLEFDIDLEEEIEEATPYLETIDEETEGDKSTTKNSNRVRSQPVIVYDETVRAMRSLEEILMKKRRKQKAQVDQKNRRLERQKEDIMKFLKNRDDNIKSHTSLREFFDKREPRKRTRRETKGNRAIKVLKEFFSCHVRQF